MICISAGHYPARAGACFGNFCEYDEANIWAILITDYLIREGHDAALVPTGILRSKTEFINSKNPLMAIEIHFNSFKIWEDANRDGLITDNELHNTGKGCETLYYPESQKGALLASNIQRELSKSFTPDRGIKEGWYRMNPKNGADFFLEKTKCPSVIVEPDFIHRKKVIQSKRNNACILIANALIKTKAEFNG